MSKEENKADCDCKYKVETICQISDKSIADQWGALSFPIYQSARSEDHTSELQSR